MSEYVGPNEVADEMIRMASAIVGGGRYFWVIEEALGKLEDNLPYGGETKVPVFVLTHHPRDTITIAGVTFRFITDGVENAVKQAKAAAADKDVMIFGPSLAQQCLNLGLIDEIQLHLAPLLLGEGPRLVDHLGPGHVKLEKMKVVDSPKVTNLRYRVVR